MQSGKLPCVSYFIDNALLFSVFFNRLFEWLVVSNVWACLPCIPCYQFQYDGPNTFKNIIMSIPNMKSQEDVTSSFLPLMAHSMKHCLILFYPVRITLACSPNIHLCWFMCTSKINLGLVNHNKLDG